MIKIDPRLLKFIIEARKKDFSDKEIKAPLLEKGWNEDEVEKAFKIIEDKQERKLRIEVSLPKNVIKIIEKRAKKNLLSIEEQIEDIIRRSAISAQLKRVYGPEKIDDLLVSIFSRRKRKKD